jgi:hypothetical protein
MMSQERSDITLTRATRSFWRQLLSGASCLIVLACLALPASAATLVLPHLAIGGGYTTTITLFTGGTAVTASHLTLRDQTGKALVVKSGDSLPWSETTFNLQIYGTQIWKLEPVNAESGTAVGSATITYDGAQGTIYGVATYEYRSGGVLRTAVGVLGSEPLDGVSVPVDSDDREARYTGFAIANVATDNLDLAVTLFDVGGNRKNQFALRVPGQGQMAVFLAQLVPSTVRFQGLMVIRSTSGGKFGAVALSERSGMYSSVSVVPTALYPF